MVVSLLIDFMPPRADRPVLVRIVAGEAGQVPMQMEWRFVSTWLLGAVGTPARRHNGPRWAAPTAFWSTPTKR